MPQANITSYQKQFRPEAIFVRPSKNVNELISETFEALKQIKKMGDVLSRGLQKQHVVLKRARAKLSPADSIIIGHVLDEISEACYAISEATLYFNSRINDALMRDGRLMVVQVKTKSGWMPDPAAEKMQNAALTLKAKRLKAQFDRDPSAMKFGWSDIYDIAPALLHVPIIKNMADFNDYLKRAAELYKKIYDKYLKQVTEIRSTLLDIERLMVSLSGTDHPDADIIEAQAQEYRTQAESNLGASLRTLQDATGWIWGQLAAAEQAAELVKKDAALIQKITDKVGDGSLPPDQAQEAMGNALDDIGDITGIDTDMSAFMDQFKV